MNPKDRHRQARKSVEWQDIHRRLERLREIIERDWAMSPEQARQILKDRAAALARPPGDGGAQVRRIEIVEFLLGGETYGVESSFVREVYPLTDLTPLPCTPPFVLGIVNVRGEILSVLDLRKFFDLPQRGLTDLNKMIILHDQNMAFGILADLILGVRDLAVDDIQPCLPTMDGRRTAYLRGMSPAGLAMLDAQTLLADDSILVNEQVAAGPPE